MEKVVARCLVGIGLDAATVSRFVKIITEGWRYTFVSFAALAVDYSLFIAAVQLAHIHYIVANVASFAGGVTVAYIGSAFWAFSVRRYSNVVVEFLLFGLTGLAGLAAGSFVLFAAIEWGGLTASIAKIVSIVVSFLFNFAVRKVLLFSESK